MFGALCAHVFVLSLLFLRDYVCALYGHGQWTRGQHWTFYVFLVVVLMLSVCGLRAAAQVCAFNRQIARSPNRKIK